MKLIIEYNETDGCTYSCTNTLPIEYESPEALAVDFEAECKRAYEQCPAGYGDFWVSNRQFNTSSFYDQGVYYPPSFYTFDEWFDANQY